MKIITNAQFIEAVDKALALRGDDFVYLPAKPAINHDDPGSNFATCTYGTPYEGATPCLFGLALTEFLGLEYQTWWECGHIGKLLKALLDAGVADIRLATPVRNAAYMAQQGQDQSRTYQRIRLEWEADTAAFRNAEGKVTA